MNPHSLLFCAGLQVQQATWRPWSAPWLVEKKNLFSAEIRGEIIEGKSQIYCLPSLSPLRSVTDRTACLSPSLSDTKKIHLFSLICLFFFFNCSFCYGRDRVLSKTDRAVWDKQDTDVSGTVTTVSCVSSVVTVSDSLDNASTSIVCFSFFSDWQMQIMRKGITQNIIVF